MRHSRGPQRLLAVVATIALLALESIALAHEIEHDLEQHDEPSCALHLYVTNFGKSVAGDFSVAPAALPANCEFAPPIAAPHAPLLLSYRGRAPPRTTAIIS